MRTALLLGSLGLLVLPSPSPAQGDPSGAHTSRVVVSGGLGWGVQVTGGYLRAEYQLTGIEQVVGVRAQLGTFWSPRQNFSTPGIIYGEDSQFFGTTRLASVDIGLTGSVSPWPRGRFSPYLLGGVGAVHRWSRDRGLFFDQDGNPISDPQTISRTRGDLTPIWGGGVRLRLGDQRVQIEGRRYSETTTIGIGTAITF